LDHGEASRWVEVEVVGPEQFVINRLFRLLARSVMPSINRPCVAFKLIGVLAQNATTFGEFLNDRRKPISLDRADFHADATTIRCTHHGRASLSLDLRLVYATMHLALGGNGAGRTPSDTDFAGVAKPWDSIVNR
jgi:hypothetical protein